MSDGKAIEVEGKIVTVLPGTMFRVQLTNGHMVLAHISGKLRKHFIKIAAGDMVKMEMSPYDLDKARIHYELFGTGLPATARRQRDSGEAIAAELCDVTVIADGRQINFGLARDTRSILDAGNEHGADLPYSCKAGVCSTCRAKVVEGEVEMDVNFALEDYEVKAGYVLSCQCFPVSKKIVLDFDTL